MSRSVPALVKPELLIWARESAGYSLEKAAALSHTDEVTLQEWENGHDCPSVAELRKLGEVYKRPIAVFFLAEPPRKFDAQREFRRLPGMVPGRESPELLQALRWAVFRRDAALEVHRLAGEAPHQLRAALHPEMDREEGGQKIRELLGVTWTEQLEWTGEYRALTGWRAAIEAKGVLVFQASGMSIEEMRGTCIPDQPFPVILLNNADAPHGRIFSLLHEFAHILLHIGGHQTSRMEGGRSPEEQPLEVAANAFAAAALLPAGVFSRLVRSFPAAAGGSDDALRRLSEQVKASPEAILYRMVTLGIAAETIYRRKKSEWQGVGRRARESKGGPSPAVQAVAKDGPSFTRLVLNAFDQRLITTSAASDYLGVKARHFPNIRRELSLRPELAEA